MEQQRESDAAMKDSIKVRSKCMVIAARLAAGDKVPMKDERYLQKNDPDMYAQAMKVRIPKKDPKEYDSILEDEDEENQEGTINVFEGPTEGGMLPGDIQTGN